MIFSTIVPYELVWDGYSAMENKAYREITVDHMTLVVEPISSTEAKIVKLVSPNPYDYTIPSLFPGSIISYVPTLANP